MQDDNVSMTAQSAPAPKKRRTSILIMFVLGLLAVFASAVIMTVLITGDLDGSAFMWPMTIMGAVIIACLLAAATIPALKEDGGH